MDDIACDYHDYFNGHAVPSCPECVELNGWEHDPLNRTRTALQANFDLYEFSAEVISELVLPDLQWITLDQAAEMEEWYALN